MIITLCFKFPSYRIKFICLLTKCIFILILGDINDITSSGGCSYDFFVINSDCLCQLNCKTDVMTLRPDAIQNSRRGQKGLSDHDPIKLVLQDRPRRVISNLI